LFDGDIRRQLPVSASRANLSAIGSAIEGCEPNKKTDVRHVFQRLAGTLPRRGMVVVLSDLLTDLNTIVEGLRRFRYGRHDVLVLHVLDHDELEFPFSDRTLFEGMEDPDVEILTDPQSLRGEYLSALRDFIGNIRRACLDQRVDYALVSTADRLDVALTTFLTTRMRLRRAKA